jgi:subtilase family serine protease
MRINRILAAALCAAGAFTTASAPAATSPQADIAQAQGQAQAQASVAAASAQDIVEFGVYLPLRNKKALESQLAQLHDTSSPQYHQWLKPDDFLQQYGPKASDIAAVSNALVARGLAIVSTNAHGVRVRGTADAVAQAFATPIQKVTQRSHTRFQARGALQVPAELAAIPLRVVGLATVPEHQVHAHVLGAAPAATGDNRYGSTGPYWFTDLKQAYDYPAYGPGTDGSGVSVAVLMSDLVFPGDVGAAFTHEKFTALTGKPAPSVTTVTVDGGGAFNGNGSVEASLDVQQVLGGAPGAQVTLVSIPDLQDQSIIDGYQYIVDTNKYDIVNSSFGGCELGYTAAYNGGVDYTDILEAEHEIFLQGNAQGITFVASSGDEAGLECPSADYGNGGTSPTFVASVSTPAADPAVTAVGGGNLVTTSSTTTLASAYVRESAFSDPESPYDPYGLGTLVSGGAWGAGGGVSTLYRKPLYQVLARTGSGQFRTVPDVGMHVGGCPAIGHHLQQRRQLGDHRLRRGHRRRLLRAHRHLDRLARVRGRAGGLRAAAGQAQPPPGQRELLPVRRGRHADAAGRHQGAGGAAVLPSRQPGLQRRRVRQLPELQLQLCLRQRQPRRAQAVRHDELPGRRRPADGHQSVGRLFQDARGACRRASALFHGARPRVAPVPARA